MIVSVTSLSPSLVMVCSFGFCTGCQPGNKVVAAQKGCDRVCREADVQSGARLANSFCTFSYVHFITQLSFRVVLFQFIGFSRTLSCNRLMCNVGVLSLNGLKSVKVCYQQHRITSVVWV